MVALQAWLLSEMRSNHIYLCFLPNETHSRSLIPVDSAQSRTKIAVTQVGVGS